MLGFLDVNPSPSARPIDTLKYCVDFIYTWLFEFVLNKDSEAEKNNVLLQRLSRPHLW